MSARLPWEHIDVGLEEGFLLREYRKAVKSRLSPPCGKVAGAFIHHTNLDDAEQDQKKLVCYDCGVACDLSAMRTERLVYLTKLGARSKRETAPKPTSLPTKKHKPPTIVQGEPRRYRFVFAKLGPMAYLSHLDLIRALPRSFRRLEVPIFYSSGFHPKPDMTFSPALSLGVASLSEVLDVKLTIDVDPEELAQRLTAASPEGLVWKSGAPLGAEDAGIAKIIDGARYAVGIPARAVTVDRLRAEIDRVLSTPDVRVVRRFERGLAKSIDVKRFLRGIAIGGSELLDEARVAGDLVPLVVDVSITGEGGVKIAEVMEALFPEGVPYHAVRAQMGLWRDGSLVSPTDLATHRSLRARAVVECARA